MPPRGGKFAAGTAELTGKGVIGAGGFGAGNGIFGSPTGGAVDKVPGCIIVHDWEAGPEVHVPMFPT